MALRLPRTATSDDRHAAWISVVKRIYDEQVNQGWNDKLFRLARAVFLKNSSLSDEGGFLFNWMAENYIEASLMLIRREMDTQDGTESLRNLLEDIAQHPEVITRARYVSQWPRGEEVVANRAFDSFQPARVAGAPERDFIDPIRARADLTSVVADAERLREYAERTRAHRTPEKSINDTITFRELRQTIADIRTIVDKYHTLLTLSSVGEWEPTAQYDTVEPFTKPWVTDASEVARAADEDAPD